MPSTPKQIRRAVQSGLARAAVVGLSRLPLPLARSIGRTLGRLAYRISRTSRRRIREQLGLAFGATRSDVAIARTARAVLPSLGAQLAEVPGLARGGIDAVIARERIEGLERMREELAAGLAPGRGLVGISGHFGHWELTAALFSRLGEVPTVCVARRYEHEGYQRILEDIRARLGVRVVHQEDSMIPVVRTLRSGGCLGLLPDQDFKQLHDGIFVPFLGRPAYTTVTPAELAIRTGAGLVVATVHRERGRLVAEASRAPIDALRESSDPIRAITEWWSRELERRVRAHPEQWVWLHRRWRTTPDRLEYRAIRRQERTRIRAERESSPGTRWWNPPPSPD